MCKSRITVLSTLIILAFGVTVVGQAMADQIIKFRTTHINVSKRFDSVEVGDKPGHIVAIFEAKGVGKRYEGPAEPPYKIEIWGTGDYQGDGTGKDGGYAKFIFSDGSSYYEKWTGTVNGDRDSGTAVYYGGTGRFKGMKEGSGSKFECILLGDRFICDVEGTIILPD
jgi:hypothetical protein